MATIRNSNFRNNNNCHNSLGNCNHPNFGVTHNRSGGAMAGKPIAAEEDADEGGKYVSHVAHSELFWVGLCLVLLLTTK